MSAEPEGAARSPWWALVVLVHVALVLTLVYWHAREAPFLEMRINAHDRIVEGRAESPYQYRLLAPLVAEWLRRALAAFLPDRYAFHGAYLLWNQLSIAGLLLGTYAFARERISASAALAGALFVSVPLIVSYVEQPYAPWSFAEPAFFVAGLLLLERRRTAAVAALTAVAALNRETALFIPLAGLLMAWVAREPEERRALLRTAVVALLAWGAAYGALRLGRGPAEPVLTLAEIVSRNLRSEEMAWTAVHLVLFLGPFWLLWPLGLRRADPALRAVSWLAVPVLGLYAVFGLWREVRILLPLVPIAVTAGLVGLRAAAPPPPRAEGP